MSQSAAIALIENYYAAFNGSVKTRPDKKEIIPE